MIAVKSGRSAAGARAATSHTGALLAASDSTVDALFRHAGVIRTGTVGELFDVAALLAGSRCRAGDRVGDRHQRRRPGHLLRRRMCRGRARRVEPLPAASRRRLARQLPRRGVALANPVDMIASASPEDYRAASSLADDGRSTRSSRSSSRRS